MHDFEKEFRIFYNKVIKDSKIYGKKLKKNLCFYCGEYNKIYCNSHSIPANFLRNIADNGKLATPNSIIDIVGIDKELGVKNSGTFNIICRDCDGKIFQEYENPDNYDAENISDEILSQIAMKNYLCALAQRYDEYALFDKFGKVITHFDLDIKEDLYGFYKSKQIIEHKLSNAYNLFYHKKLDYVVPIAFQHLIALNLDLNGEEINDLYNKNPEYRIQCMHMCVFPLRAHTEILLFTEKQNHRYDLFIEQLKKLEHEDQLAVINFIIFSYTDTYYLSPKIRDIKDLNLSFIASNIPCRIKIPEENSNNKEIMNDMKILFENNNCYDLNLRNEIKNILLEKYKIDNY